MSNTQEMTHVTGSKQTYRIVWTLPFKLAGEEHQRLESATIYDSESEAKADAERRIRDNCAPSKQFDIEPRNLEITDPYKADSWLKDAENIMQLAGLEQDPSGVGTYLYDELVKDLATALKTYYGSVIPEHFH